MSSVVAPTLLFPSSEHPIIIIAVIKSCRKRLSLFLFSYQSPFRRFTAAQTIMNFFCVFQRNQNEAGSFLQRIFVDIYPFQSTLISSLTLSLTLFGKSEIFQCIKKLFIGRRDVPFICGSQFVYVLRNKRMPSCHKSSPFIDHIKIENSR